MGEAGRSSQDTEGVKDENRCCAVSPHGEVTLMTLTSYAQVSRSLSAKQVINMCLGFCWRGGGERERERERESDITHIALHDLISWPALGPALCSVRGCPYIHVREKKRLLNRVRYNTVGLHTRSAPFL